MEHKLLGPGIHLGTFRCDPACNFAAENGFYNSQGIRVGGVYRGVY